MNTTQPAYTSLASQVSIDKTVESLKSHNIESIVVSTKEEALEIIKERIPKGASVMNGSSETLREIGFVDFLKSERHGWNNLHAQVLAETDPAKQQELRNQALFSDYYLGSAHALTETGEIMIASYTGSQLPHLIYTSPKSILVIGSHKIVLSLDAAFKRLDEYVVPLEDERLRKQYGIGTEQAKTLILHRQGSISKQEIMVIIVNEKLGF